MSIVWKLKHNLQKVVCWPGREREQRRVEERVKGTKILILKCQKIQLNVNGTRNWGLSILFKVENIINRRIIV